MTEKLKIWLDDQRLPPPAFNVWFKTRDGVDGLPDFVKANADHIEVISFDNSLGCHVEGHTLLNAIESMVCADGLRLPMLKELCVHTGDSNQVMPMIYACQHIAQRHEGVNVYRTDYEWDCDRLKDEIGFSAYMAWRDAGFQGQLF
jgi:hypothetical protein